MDKIIVFIFFILVGYLLVKMLNGDYKQPNVITDKPTIDTPRHVLRDVLNNISGGDKVSLSGDCAVNIYTRNTISTDMGDKFKRLLNQIFERTHGLTQDVYSVQEVNNIYEQLDGLGNGRYIIDGTLNSINNYYTLGVILDVVMLNGDVLINYISTNDASNNNIVDRYDIVYQDQGILLNHNMFTENIRSLLDNQYKKVNNLISVNTKRLDEKNYNLENVMSLNSILNKYYPAKISSGTLDNFKLKGMQGQLENYFPSDLVTVDSPQYCDRLNGQRCIFQHNSTQTEYTQPFVAPGLFFDRSSYPIN